MTVFYDQLGRGISLASPPKRIISLVPSQTELLFELGLDAEIAGITKFCVHPASKTIKKPTVGGTKQLNIQLIKQLAPDLIIANKEENDQVQIEALMDLFPVWVSDIKDLMQAQEMICNVGELTGREMAAAKLNQDITGRFKILPSAPINLTVAYLIWRKPYMAAGKGTFIDDMLGHCGITNAFAKERYPQVSAELLVDTKPDVVFFSSEPYPFKQKHAEELKLLLPDAVIQLVDGEVFSWYGSRLLQAPAYFKSLREQLIGTKSSKAF